MPDDELAAVVREIDAELAERAAALPTMDMGQVMAIGTLKPELAEMRVRLDVLTPRAPVVRVPGRPGRPKADIDVVRLRALAALGLSHKHAASRLGVSLRTLAQRLEDDPEVRAAWDDGLAEAVETAAAGIKGLAEQGNLGALIFFLKTKGGFNTPRDPAPAPMVQVNVGQQPATVTTAHADLLAAEQRQMLEDPVIEGEAEAE